MFTRKEEKKEMCAEREKRKKEKSAEWNLKKRKKRVRKANDKKDIEKRERERVGACSTKGKDEKEHGKEGEKKRTWEKYENGTK